MPRSHAQRKLRRTFDREMASAMLGHSILPGSYLVGTYTRSYIYVSTEWCLLKRKFIPTHTPCGHDQPIRVRSFMCVPRTVGTQHSKAEIPVMDLVRLVREMPDGVRVRRLAGVVQAAVNTTYVCIHASLPSSAFIVEYL